MSSYLLAVFWPCGADQVNRQDVAAFKERAGFAQEVLQQLSSRFEIFIATQAMAVPNSLGPKYRWLQRHFSFIPPSHYVFCGDKGILRADYLIDDLPKNLQRFEGQGLLYTAPHNHGETGFVRVNNWQEVAEYFAVIER